ncbi:hypothetical protein PHET_02275 [Paragonimus heterotremus]|uniref:Uncharacterized protein n=1 Tax=Paragonimus heterotremus TaxID=100268 RepID=A0A8J4TL75_9TREM|nr:hypothetical protein PHET_02275 [Paragonimus heterotremus]
MSNFPTVSGLPPELRIDLTELAEDLLALQLDEVLYLNTSSNSGGGRGSDSIQNSPSAHVSSISSPMLTDLIRRANKMRANIQRAQDAARKLNACELDLESQEKLLLAMSTSCITKRHLICLLKRDLSRFFKDPSSAYFDSP